MKKLCMIGASAFAMMSSVPAFAQDTAPTDGDVTTEDSGDVVEDAEIVITAQGRAQIAQDIPVSVNVVSPTQIENAGISDIRGIRQVAPSLQTTTGQSSATGVVLRIRGIGTAGDNPGFEPAVGVFIDGVFRARAGVALSDLPPLERVEVLRGPQGTLFGRNTSAGALNITTAKPEFNFGGYGEISYGSYDEIEVKAGLTGPIGDTAALRLDGGYHKRDGYIKDANSDRRFNDINRFFVRGQALFESDNLSFRLIGDYAETDENCCGALNTNSGFILFPLGRDTSSNSALAFAASSVIQAASATPALGGAVGRVGIVRPFDAEARTMAVTPGRDLTEQVNEWGLSGELNYDFGNVKLTSITAYRDWDATRDQDIDFSGLDRAYRDDYKTGVTDFTQEIRLRGSAFNGKLDWLVGGFFLNEKLTLHDTLRFGAQADQYVDGVINGLTRSTLLPTGMQLYGTLGPGVPLFGQVALVQNPLLASAPGFNAASFLTPIARTPNGAGQIGDDYRVKTNAIAIFTHNIINITDNVSLTLGVRWNHETKKINANLNSSVPGCSFLNSANSAVWRAALNGAGLGTFQQLICNPTVDSAFNGTYSGKRSESKLTGTAKLAFKVSDNVLIYGGYDRGYKSGGYNLDRGSFDTVRAIGTNPPGNGPQITDLEFGPESADVFEIGLKSNITRKFQFNIGAFHSNFKGYQNNAFMGTRFVVQNFDKVISQGIEIESIIRPDPDMVLMLGYTLLDTEVKDIRAGDDNGRSLSNAPRHVVTGAFTWTPQITDSVGALFHVDWRLNSDSNTAVQSPVGIPFTTNDGYGIVNLRVGMNFGPDGNFGIEGFVENLFNTYYNVTSFPVPEQGNNFAVYPAPPRFYGVKLRAKF